MKAKNLDIMWAEKACQSKSAMTHKEVFVIRGMCLFSNALLSCFLKETERNWGMKEKNISICKTL